MKNKYSVFSLIKNALSQHENWQQAWGNPEPKKEYDAIIVGGGGHGLATAYYLAKKHNLKNIAVLEKGWIGGGNTGRNTTIIRSNYLWDASAGLYDHALKLWENLSQELNYNVMFSQRGVMNLAHNLQDVRDLKRRTHANRLNGIDAVWLNTEEVKKFCPIINTSPDIRYPVLGGTLQRRAGTARHDAVAWGYARGASDMGVDIIQNCEVKGIKRNGDFGNFQASQKDTAEIWQLADTVIIRFSQINEASFVFWRDTEYQEQTNGNPFAEPINLSHNINGGFGIWEGKGAIYFKVIAQKDTTFTERYFPDIFEGIF